MGRQETSQSSFPVPSPDTKGPLRNWPHNSEEQLSKKEGEVVPVPTREGGEVMSPLCWYCAKGQSVLSSSKDREGPSLELEKQIQGLHHPKGLLSNLEIVHFLGMLARK